MELCCNATPFFLQACGRGEKERVRERVWRILWGYWSRNNEKRRSQKSVRCWPLENISLYKQERLFVFVGECARARVPEKERLSTAQYCQSCRGGVYVEAVSRESSLTQPTQFRGNSRQRVFGLTFGNLMCGESPGGHRYVFIFSCCCRELSLCNSTRRPVSVMCLRVSLCQAWVFASHIVLFIRVWLRRQCSCGGKKEVYRGVFFLRVPQRAFVGS